MASNPWVANPFSGPENISGPGGENPMAPKKKKKVVPVSPSTPKKQITGPGAVYHGWKVPEGVPNKTGKDWGTWGPLTAGAGGTGGYGGSAWNFLHNLPSDQKGSVFGWLGKNYNPAQGQGGNIGAAQALLKSGDYAGFLKMVGAGGGGGENPWKSQPAPGIGDINGPGGINPALRLQTNPFGDPRQNINGPGGMDPKYRMLPEFPQDTQGASNSFQSPLDTQGNGFLANLLRQMQGQSGPSYSRW